MEYFSGTGRTQYKGWFYLNSNLQKTLNPLLRERAAKKLHKVNRSLYRRLYLMALGSLVTLYALHWNFWKTPEILWRITLYLKYPVGRHVSSFNLG